VLKGVLWSCELNDQGSHDILMTSTGHGLSDHTLILYDQHNKKYDKSITQDLILTQDLLRLCKMNFLVRIL